MSAARGHRATAAALLLVGGAAQFAWHHVPPSAAPDVWNACQALLLLLALALVGVAYPSGWVRAACALLGAYQALTPSRLTISPPPLRVR